MNHEIFKHVKYARERNRNFQQPSVEMTKEEAEKARAAELEAEAVMDELCGYESIVSTK